jgi:iron complex transport system substrate-binding protein
MIERESFYMSMQQMKKIFTGSLAIFMLVMMLAACGNKPAGTETEAVITDPAAAETGNAKQGQEESNAAGTEKDRPQTDAEQSKFPLTITDGAGEQVTIESEPKSIVTLVPSNTEIVFALGAGDRVVGVDEYSNFPEQTANIEKIGAQNMDVEKILALKPELALVTDYHFKNHKEILKQFQEAGINVVVIKSPKSFEETYASMLLIGEITGTKENAEKLISDMKKRLDGIKEKAKSITAPKKVWVEVSPAPDIFTTGKGTFMHEMLETINAINAAGDQEGWVKLTEEQIVQLMPEVIVTTYGYYVDKPIEGVLGRQGWSEVPAIKTKAVFDVHSDLVNRPGPRLVDGVETLAKAIYPEIFAK